MIHCHIVLVLCDIVQCIRAECDYSDRIGCYFNFMATSWQEDVFLFRVMFFNFIHFSSSLNSLVTEKCMFVAGGSWASFSRSSRHGGMDMNMLHLYKRYQDKSKLPKRASQSRNTMFFKRKGSVQNDRLFQRTLRLSTGRIYGFHKNYVKRRCFYLANRQKAD